MSGVVQGAGSGCCRLSPPWIQCTKPTSPEEVAVVEGESHSRCLRMPNAMLAASPSSQQPGRCKERERESEEFTQFERRCFAGLVACRIFSIAVGMLAFAHCMFPAYL